MRIVLALLIATALSNPALAQSPAAAAPTIEQLQEYSAVLSADRDAYMKQLDSLRVQGMDQQRAAAAKEAAAAKDHAELEYWRAWHGFGDPKPGH